MYDDTTGEQQKDLQGNPKRRPKGIKVRCQTTAGCPKGTPEKPKGLTPENYAAYTHYLRCKAVGRFPDDGLVAHQAMLIEMALNSVDDTKQIRSEQRLAAMLTGKK